MKSRRIQLTLDDYDELITTDKKVGRYVDKDIEVVNHVMFYDKVEKLKKFDINVVETLELINYALENNLKYEVSDSDELCLIIEHINNCRLTTVNLNWLNTKNVDTMNYLFAYSKFNGDISEWDVSNVKGMSCMFKEAFFNGDISKWKTSSLSNADSMFAYSSFNLDISDWDVSHVVSANNMFERSDFNLPLGKWDLKNLTWATAMFRDCNYEQDLSSWELPHLIHAPQIFWSCPIKEEFKPAIFRDNANISIHNSISESTLNLNLDDFDFNDNDGEEIHSNKKGLAVDLPLIKTWLELDPLLRKLNEQTLTKEELNKIVELSSKVKYKYLVENKNQLEELVKYISSIDRKANLNWIDISLVRTLGRVFYNVDFDGDISEWNTHNVTSLYETFMNCPFNGDLSKWDTSNVYDMTATFEGSKFNGDISNWNTSKVDSMEEMFHKSIFDKDISKWDTSKVESMQGMFRESAFNKDISNWNTSKVTNMRSMFNKSKFDKDISKWDTSKVEDMSYMFGYSKFNKSLNEWDVSNVTDMTYMFWQAKFNLPIDKWEVGNVTNMSYMFGGSCFKQDISNWSINDKCLFEMIFSNASPMPKIFMPIAMQNVLNPKHLGKSVLESANLNLVLDDTDELEVNHAPKLALYKDNQFSVYDEASLDIVKRIITNINKVERIDRFYGLLLEKKEKLSVMDLTDDESEPLYKQIGFHLKPEEKEMIVNMFLKHNPFKGDFVDLDLPSGTLWCNRNLGAKTADDNGEEYMWGKTKKVRYGSDSKITSSYSDLLIDGKCCVVHLRPFEDPALDADGNWITPSPDHFKELVENTKYVNVTPVSDLSGAPRNTKHFAVILISKTNPFKFITIINDNNFYLTTEIRNYDTADPQTVKNPGKSLYLYLFKPFNNSTYAPHIRAMKSLNKEYLPSIRCKVRPICLNPEKEKRAH